jgi:ankyrin repeat protein
MKEVVALIAFGAIFALVGLVFVIAPLKGALDRIRFSRNATRTKGHVISMRVSDDREMMLPLIEYTASDGRKRQFEPRYWTNRPRQFGDEVDVLYDAFKPDDVRIAFERRDFIAGIGSFVSGAIALGLGMLALTAGLHRPAEKAKERVAEEFIAAAERGDVAAVRAMLAKDRRLVDATKLASTEDEGRIVIDRPLHAAARGLSVDVVDLLLASGVSANATLANGNTALHEVGSKTTVGDEPASAKRVAIIRALLAKRANVNARGNDRRTPLQENAHDPNAVELLIASGADVNAADGSGQTPLDAALAPAWDNRRAVRMLIARGANVNASDNDASTPILQVLGSTWPLEHSIETLAVLCAAGARLDIPPPSTLPLGADLNVHRAMRKFVARGGPCERLAKSRASEDQQAFATAEATCAAGSRWGCGMAGYLLNVGKGVKEDIPRAAAYYKQACDAGEATSCENLARLQRD